MVEIVMIWALIYSYKNVSIKSIVVNLKKINYKNIVVIEIDFSSEINFK